MCGEYIISPYIVELMQGKIPFLVFYDNKQLFEGGEVEEYLDNVSRYGLGLLENAKRNPYMIGHWIEDKNRNTGYFLKDVRSLYSMLIPDEIIEQGYEMVKESVENEQIYTD